MAWSRTSRHERGYSSEWDRTRKRILARDKGLCQPCKRKGKYRPAKSVDHIKPKSQSGTDDDGNLESTCAPCHSAKTQRESAEAQGRTYRHRPRVGLDGWPRED